MKQWVDRTLHRRDWLIAALGLCSSAASAQTLLQNAPGAAPGVQPERISDRARQAIEELLAGRTPSPGRVVLQIPKLAENGFSVPLQARVESPMTSSDYVQTLHIIAPANPIATVARVHFTPRSGAAWLNTRVRLADTQRVLGFAEMSDGSIWSGSAHVIVTLGGCVDPVL